MLTYLFLINLESVECELTVYIQTRYYLYTTLYSGVRGGETRRGGEGWNGYASKGEGMVIH